jgi:hypothetical protein
MSAHYTSHPTIPVNQLELAALPTIDFAKLTSGDTSEAQRLLDACVTQGFFYLDLQGSNSSSKILADHYALLDVMKNYFDQPHEVKMGDNIESVTDGLVFLYFHRALLVFKRNVDSNPLGHSPE